MTFNVGDRVVYTGLYKGFNQPKKRGWTGTVCRSIRDQCWVNWDNGKLNYGCYSENIGLIEPAVDEIAELFV